MVGIVPPALRKANTQTPAPGLPDTLTKPEIVPSAARRASIPAVTLPERTTTGVDLALVALWSNHCDANPPDDSSQSVVNSIRYLPGASPPREYLPSEAENAVCAVPWPISGVAITQLPPTARALLPPVTRPAIRPGAGSATSTRVVGLDAPTLTCVRSTVDKASPPHGPTCRL